VEDQVKNNIIRVLNDAINALRRGNIKTLKDLSNETIHDATLYQDEYSITIAVLFYSLSKIHERDVHYQQFKGWKYFCYDCIKRLEVARDKLKENKLEEFELVIKQYMNVLQKLDKKLVNYIQDVLRNAKITKASRLYEHGLSIGRTAELLGVTRFELMDYVGKTYIADMGENKTFDVKERLKFVRGLFS